MKNEEAKEILSAYRPNGEDAADPIFHEALEQARRDPELAAWFKAERKTDASLARIFQGLPVPGEGKSSLLTLARLEPQVKRRGFRLWAGALAACFIAALVLTLSLYSPETGSGFTMQEPRSIGVPELAGLAYNPRPFEFRSDSLPELRAWLVGRGAPAPANLPENLASLSAVGCRVFSDNAGNSITLLCLERNGEMVHLFVTEGPARQSLAMAEKTWISEDGWNTYCWSDETRAYVIMSRAPKEELETLII